MADFVLVVFGLLPILLVLGPVVGIAGVSAVTFLTKSLHHVPEWMVIPPLSMIGFLNPERTLYSAAASATAVVCFIACLMLHLVYRALLTRGAAPNSSSWAVSRFSSFANGAAFSLVTVACCAAVFQAAVPIQEDFAIAMHGYKPILPQTTQHLAAAAVFWATFVAHSFCVSCLVWRAPGLTFLRRNWTFRARWVLIAVSVGCGVGTIASQPSLPAPQSTVLALWHLSAVMSWVSVLSLFAIVATYAIDARSALEHLGVHTYLFSSRAARRVAVPDS